jgi:hypothetical protein
LCPPSAPVLRPPCGVSPRCRRAVNTLSPRREQLNAERCPDSKSQRTGAHRGPRPHAAPRGGRTAQPERKPPSQRRRRAAPRTAQGWSGATLQSTPARPATRVARQRAGAAPQPAAGAAMQPQGGPRPQSRVGEKPRAAQRRRERCGAAADSSAARNRGAAQGPEQCDSKTPPARPATKAARQRDRYGAAAGGLRRPAPGN